MYKFGEYKIYLKNFCVSKIQGKEYIKMKQVYETTLSDIAEPNFFINFEPVILCSFVLFAAYVLYQCAQCHIRRVQDCSYTMNEKKGNTHIYNTESCPICLGEFIIPIRVNCGHAFCMQCLLSYFQYNTCFWKRVCPLCRDLIHDIYNLHTFDYCKKEKAEIKKMEKKLKCFIEEQNSTMKYMSRIEWIVTNKWKSIFSILSITVSFITLLFWLKVLPF